MPFTSTVFLFVFLPLVLWGQLMLPARWRNLFLMGASLVFYAWGELFYALIMVVSILANYTLARWMNKTAPGRGKKVILGFAVGVNLSLLTGFKYANFLVDNLNALGRHMDLEPLVLDPVHLPIGISFFTFQSLSYVIDVYRGRVAAENRLINVALYISLFPQLIAGPIVRYRDIAREIRSRTLQVPAFVEGVQRFVIGLAKKMLIANPMGALADQIMATPAAELSFSMAWLGAACYTLQIYHDFSGYSDMAIGLGRMLGFTFPENFNYPYVSRSIREFWRRWHISLSTWFRDYLYFPLGGNRRRGWHTAFNLWTVFLLCGLWHGASWNFIVWGALHGTFLVLERIGEGRWVTRLWSPIRHLYVMGVVMAGWVVFRLETLAESGAYLQAMIGWGSAPAGPPELVTLFDWPKQLLFAVAVIAAVGGGRFPRAIARRFPSLSRGVGTRQGPGLYRSAEGAKALVLLGLFVWSVMEIAAGTYNPFIYFRF